MSTATSTTRRVYASGAGYITRMRLADAVRHNNDPDMPNDYVTLRTNNANDGVLRFEKAEERPNDLKTLEIEGVLMSDERFVGTYDLDTGYATYDVTEL